MTSEQLIEAARTAREYAYAPYSGYAVGAAVETADGTVYTGCNVENVAFPQSLCAERVAIAKAVSAGHRRVRRVAVVTANGGTPCGGCRSVMAEFSAEATEIIVADLAGTVHRYTLGELLPASFELRSELSRPPADEVGGLHSSTP